MLAAEAEYSSGYSKLKWVFAPPQFLHSQLYVLLQMHLL
jgi:hypothetical protein